MGSIAWLTNPSKIAEGSGQALTFSRKYGDKAHNTQRAGLTSESMPSLTECDEMLKRQRGVLASMERIRVCGFEISCDGSKFFMDDLIVTLGK